MIAITSSQSICTPASPNLHFISSNNLFKSVRPMFSYYTWTESRIQANSKTDLNISKVYIQIVWYSLKFSI